MPAAATPSVFVESLHRSGLFTAQEYQDLLYLAQSAGLHPADNKSIATWCVQEGYLTKFQAKQLLAGKWRNFVISNKYMVLEPLGEGGMGAVFRCQHLALRKEVALKVLPKEVTQNPAALQRFLREAQALAALDHPNIVQAHDVDEAQGQYFIVMSCVEGRTLLDLVRQNGPLSPGQAADYLRQACRGLQHAHEAGWVHRDLKPGNLILDQSGVIKITDFGLARLASEEGSVTRQFEDCNVLGSPDYISPEQAMNRPDIDIRADIYSLGATLYFLLTGRGPFEGEPLLQKLLAHQLREPEEVTRFRGDVAPGMLEILKRMMAKNPADRFATPRDVEDALRPFVRAHPPQQAPSTTNRLRGGKTLRVPRVDPSARPTKVDGYDTATPLPLPAAPPAPAPLLADLMTEPAAEYGPGFPEEEDAGFTLSPKMKRWLQIGAAAAALLILGTLGTMWFFAEPSRAERLERASALGRRQQWKGAAEIYAELLKESPPNSKEFNELHHQVKDWGPMAVFLIDHFPNDVAFNRSAGKQYAKENDLDRAIVCYERMVIANAEDPLVWREYCDLLIPQRNWKKAIRCLEEACRLKPDNPEWSRDRAFVYAAMADWENYRRVCKETYERFGQRDKPWGNRIEVAYAFCQGSNPPEILDDVLRVARDMTHESPQDTNHLFRYGAALYRAAKYQEAYDVLKRVRGDDGKPGYEPHRCEPVMAMCLYNMGRKEEARRLLAEHIEWYDGEVAKKRKTPFVPILAAWWDSLALENLRREAEILIEGKSRL